jgi:hypothetical protein
MGQRNPAVDAWMARYDNPLKQLVERVREIVLGADDRIGETIKWSAPTFVYKGNLATFQPRAKQYVTLVFHDGASIPGTHPLLEGDGERGRSARLLDARMIEDRRGELEAIVRAWCDSRDAAG